MQGLRCWPVQGSLFALETVIKNRKGTEGAKKELEIGYREQKRLEIVEEERGRTREGETDSTSYSARLEPRQIALEGYLLKFVLAATQGNS